MSALICGSYAFDNIMVFEDKFKNHILPDQVHILNVSFLVPELRREFGGCAGNIAYNLKLLGGEPLPMATVGQDFSAYSAWMDHCGINQQYISVLEECYTAQAYITTDMDDNQITAFHPGAMNFAHTNQVSEATGITIGMISPDGKQGMVEHAQQFAEAGLSFIFDPGQGLPMFSGEELRQFIEQATWIAVNDYESQLLLERTGLSLKQMAEQVEAVIVTKGGKGASIYTTKETIEIPTAKTEVLNDPTGCGDAFRGGLLYGMMNNLDWQTTGRIASLLGALKIECHGTQNHTFEMDAFKARFDSEFGYSFD